MSISIIITTALLAFSALLLILLVLLQNPKEEGQNVLGGSAIQNLVGVVRATSLVEKATYALAFLIFVSSLFTAFLIKQEYGKKEESAVVEHLEQYERQKD